MKTEPIVQEIENIKDRLSEQAIDMTQFSRQMNAWLEKHPYEGTVVHSPEELEARVRNREATEKPLPPMKPYRVHDPIIAEVHRTRAKLYRERKRKGGNTLDRLFAEAREQQKNSGHRVVNLQDERKEISYALHDAPRKKNKK